MAGFGATMSKLIEEDRQYYRAKAEKRKDYLQTYGTKAVVDIEGKANDALAVANQLQDFGFSKGFVTGITNKSGVRGMYDFAQNVLKRTDLTPDDIKELETSALDFVSDNPEEDLETVINRAYGLYKSESDPVKRKTGMLGAMLGLDAQALEDQVINADYYGGYSGQDLIRIAASSGPKAGKPLGIKLPPKPLSPTEYGQVNKLVNSTFDNAIARQIDELGVLVKQGGPEVQKVMEELTKLQDIQKLAKSDPNSAINTYLKDYDTNGEFLSYLQGLESNGLGRVSRNFLLGKEVIATFKTLSGDRADDASLEGRGVEIPTLNTTPRGSEVNTVVTPITYTQASVQKAVENGDIKVGDTIAVDGKEIVVKQGFIDTYTKATPPVDPEPKVDAEAARIDEIRERQQSAMSARFQKWIAPLMTPAVDQGYGNTKSGMTPFGPISYTSLPMDDVPIDDSWKDSSYLLPEDADALSDAVIGGEIVAGFLSKTSDFVNTKGYTYMDVGKAGLANAMSTVIDFGRGLFNSSKADSSEAWSRQLQENAELYSERAADIAAMGWKEYMQLNIGEEVPDEVEAEVKSGFFDWFTGPENPIGSLMEMIGVGTEAADGEKKTNSEIIAAARGMLSDEANARIDAGTNIIEQSREEFTPEFPGDVPDNLEEATTESISKALRFLTELPDRIHQSLFDTQDMINASIASLFEETLGERIMKSKGQKNRVVALQALKDKITEMRKAAEAEDSVDTEPSAAEDGFVPRFPGDTRQQQAMVARDNKVEPLVRRPKKPKEMTSSDKARLKRAQKANELSGDSGLLNMLVEKYGSVIVQKEMGL